jgi:transcriptional regulator of aromatic amino acid metabolism
MRRVSRKRKSNSRRLSVPGRARRLALFGPPLLLEGDAAAYDQLLARICEAVKPVDIIDEMTGKQS